MDFTQSITWKLGSQPVMVFLSICGQDADAGIKSRNQLSSGRKGVDVKFYNNNNYNNNNNINNNINNNKRTLVSSHGIS